MKSQTNKKFFSSIFFVSMLSLIMFFPFKSSIRAESYSIQDTMKHGEMKHGQMQHMQHGSMSGMKSDMQKMHKQMMSMKMTGDPDYDFAQMMIQHHKGAIDMSKKEISKGKDKEVKSMAKQVIDDQNREIKELQAYVKKNRSSKAGKAEESDVTGSTEKSMKDKMNDMQTKMQDMNMTGDQDKDYVSMMMIHHEHGIDLAKDYMDKAKDANLKKMAQQMVDENQKQMDKMKDWQGNHK